MRFRDFPHITVYFITRQIISQNQGSPPVLFASEIKKDHTGLARFSSVLLY
jgi:hypothetical protein